MPNVVERIFDPQQHSNWDAYAEKNEDGSWKISLDFNDGAAAPFGVYVPKRKEFDYIECENFSLAQIEAVLRVVKLINTRKED